MLSICHEHDTVTTWGCRQCLREEGERIAKECLEAFGKEYRERVERRHCEEAGSPKP